MTEEKGKGVMYGGQEEFILSSSKMIFACLHTYQLSFNSKNELTNESLNHLRKYVKTKFYILLYSLTTFQ